MQPERQPEEPERRFREVPRGREEGVPGREGAPAGYTPGEGPAPSRAAFPYSLVVWPPVVGGTLASLATLVLLNLLGGTIFITGVTNPAAFTAPFVLDSGHAIWTFCIFLASLFIGGWVTARALGLRGRRVAMLNAGVMWALLVTVGVFLSIIGAQAVLGRILGGLVFFRVGGPVLTETSFLWMFVALLGGLAFALLGAYVGRVENILAIPRNRR